MQKLLTVFTCIVFLFFISCNSKKSQVTTPVEKKDTVEIFPVTQYLKGQLNILDSMSITPLRIISKNNKIDSVWLKRNDIRKFAGPFLHPLIDSTAMHSFYSENSFLDQTINSYTFSFDANGELPDSIHLTHWDVYMDPQNNSITRIYLLKEKADTTQQLTWVVNKGFSIRTIVQNKGKEPTIQEEKMIWNFDE